MNVAAIEPAKPKSKSEIERLRERLGTVTLLIDCGRRAMVEGRAGEAIEFLNLAEQAAGAGLDRLYQTVLDSGGRVSYPHSVEIGGPR